MLHGIETKCQRKWISREYPARVVRIEPGLFQIKPGRALMQHQDRCKGIAEKKIVLDPPAQSKGETGRQTSGNKDSEYHRPLLPPEAEHRNTQAKWQNERIGKLGHDRTRRHKTEQPELALIRLGGNQTRYPKNRSQSVHQADQIGLSVPGSQRNGSARRAKSNKHPSRIRRQPHASGTSPKQRENSKENRPNGQLGSDKTDCIPPKSVQSRVRHLRDGRQNGKPVENRKRGIATHGSHPLRLCQVIRQSIRSRVRQGSHCKQNHQQRQPKHQNVSQPVFRRPVSSLPSEPREKSYCSG